VIDGSSHDATKEWVTQGQLAGAWIRLAWPAQVRVAQVNLWDRPDDTENVLGGTLTFSDGSSVAVGALHPDGNVVAVTFAPKLITWVRFTVDAAQGTATGLSELEVLGAPAASTADIPPNFVLGPAPTSDAIRSGQTTALALQVNDLDGDPVQVHWSADGGTVLEGSPAVFSPPVVGTQTVFSITSQLLDGRGGVSSNTTFVTVTP
jgi:hypothetical protein